MLPEVSLGLICEVGWREKERACVWFQIVAELQVWPRSSQTVALLLPEIMGFLSGRWADKGCRSPRGLDGGFQVSKCSSRVFPIHFPVFLSSEVSPSPCQVGLLLFQLLATTHVFGSESRPVIFFPIKLIPLIQPRCLFWADPKTLSLFWLW